jgi:hypothetical protein
MKFIPKQSCPSNQCLKSLGRDGPIALLAVSAQATPRQEWFEELIRFKKAHPEHLTDGIYECPYCHLVWTQPGNFDPGFRAVPRGYHRSDPDRLDPVPSDVRMKDPSGHLVPEGRGKRR